jgi:hypothetical protein
LLSGFLFERFLNQELCLFSLKYFTHHLMHLLPHLYLSPMISEAKRTVLLLIQVTTAISNSSSLIMGRALVVVVVVVVVVILMGPQ